MARTSSSAERRTCISVHLVSTTPQNKEPRLRTLPLISGRIAIETAESSSTEHELRSTFPLPTMGFFPFLTDDVRTDEESGRRAIEGNRDEEEKRSKLPIGRSYRDRIKPGAIHFSIRLPNSS